MQDEASGRGRQGTVTVLALLLGLLLGYAPAAASAVGEIDRTSARFGKPDVGKAGAALRAGTRVQSDDVDDDEGGLGASGARPVTFLLGQRPAARPVAASAAAPRAPLARANRARAPPAA